MPRSFDSISRSLGGYLLAACLTLSVSYAQGAADACSTLFGRQVTDANQADSLASAQSLAGRVTALRSKTLELYSANARNPALSESLHNMTFEIHQLLRGNVTPARYLEAGLIYADAADFVLSNTAPAERLRFYSSLSSEDRSDAEALNASGSLEDNRHYVRLFYETAEQTDAEAGLVPTLGALDHRAMMTMWGNQDFPVGLSDSPERVHKIVYFPNVFIRHDIVHARTWLKAVSWWADKRGVTSRELLREFRDLNSRLLHAIDVSTEYSHQEKQRLYYIWYIANHEQQRVITRSAAWAPGAQPAWGRDVDIIYSIEHLDQETPEFRAEVGVSLEVWRATNSNLLNLIRSLGL